jgi:hypothetical protein
MSATATVADDKSDCREGVAMITPELKKQYPAPVLVTLRKALSDAGSPREQQHRANFGRQGRRHLRTRTRRTIAARC